MSRLKRPNSLSKQTWTTNSRTGLRRQASDGWMKEDEAMGDRSPKDREKKKPTKKDDKKKPVEPIPAPKK